MFFMKNVILILKNVGVMGKYIMWGDILVFAQVNIASSVLEYDMYTSLPENTFFILAKGNFKG